MMTGHGGRLRYRTTTALTLASALAVPLVLSGCEDHSPVAAPTSTLPAKDSSTATPATDPQPTIPAYKTELDLSPEETKAVEGALVALDAFVSFTNSLYESGGEELEGVNEVATDDSLDEVNQAAKKMINESKKMIGEVTVERRTISKINLETQDRTVLIRACSPSQTYHFESPDQTAPGTEDTSNPEFEFTLTLKNKSWKVAKQAWIREECAS